MLSKNLYGYIEKEIHLSIYAEYVKVTLTDHR